VRFNTIDKDWDWNDALFFQAFDEVIYVWLLRDDMLSVQ
jgi:hypothetical protein